MQDDVPPNVKQERLKMMIDMFREKQLEKSHLEVGRSHLVLIDAVSKRSDE
jgi:tRNA A37 methylthiotransferase MiaB